jgi:hypothetical protein
MPNWCNTEYILRGEKENLEACARIINKFLLEDYPQKDRKYGTFQLMAEEKKLKEGMKEVILQALKENGGKITFTPQDEEGEYPVCVVLWGKHDNPLVEITDVYLGKQEEIFVDGIEQFYGIIEKEFLIYEEQYREILHFIGAVLEWKKDSSPVTATFRDNKDNPDINITDVYLDKHDRILVDGYNGWKGIRETRLEVESEQYRDVLHFIGFVLGWENGDTEPKKHEITVLFGSELIAQYSETGKIPSEEWLLKYFFINNT